jgi:hypothetical protein
VVSESGLGISERESEMRKGGGFQEGATLTEDGDGGGGDEDGDHGEAAREERKPYRLPLHLLLL